MSGHWDDEKGVLG
ncbi:MAG: hypothetical protein LBE46_00975 [Wolbachia pipientis]|nr:hypothetical protein [Wolbachia pipientis]